jgi:hypothetical protein
MTLDQFPYTDLVRTWPGHFLIQVFRENQIEQLIGAGNQAELHERLSSIIKTTQHAITINIQRIHQGGPMPIAQLEITQTHEIMNLTVPITETLNSTTPQLMEIRGDYERIRDQELSSIEATLKKHPDESFANAFLTTVAVIRKHRPKWLPEAVRSIESANVPAKLQEYLENLRKGHSIITAQTVRAWELRQQGVQLKSNETECTTPLETELFDISISWDAFDPSQDRWEYADTTAGARSKRWDDLCIGAYALAVRAAPTPLAWWGQLEYRFADETLKQLHERITRKSIK